MASLLATSDTHNAVSRAKWLPAWTWVRRYPRTWLRGDITAGLALAAYLVPAGMADASLAGLPAQAGLYACMFSGFVFWLFCSSDRTVITVTSAISLLIGVSLAPMAQGDVSRFAALAACTALMVAAISTVAYLVRAGGIVDFISEPVMDGFKTGVALFLMSSQLPKLCGIPVPHGGFWERSWYLTTHLSQVNVWSLAVGASALFVLAVGKWLSPNRPVALLVVVAAIAVAPVLRLEEHGVKLLGHVPQGFPVPQLPSVQWSDLNDLLPLAFACFLLGAVETAAIARMFQSRSRMRFDANQEFVALAAANVAAGVGGGFPVSGGMSQSLVNTSSGAHTPLSGFVAAGIVLAVILFASSMLSNLPQPVLAAVVLVAVSGLFRPRALIHLYRVDRAEFVAAAATVVGVLASGLLRGVMIGAVISLVQLIRRASRPHVARLGRVPGTRRFSDIDRHPDNIQEARGVLLRPEASLVYFNIGHVCETIADAVAAHQQPLKFVVLDLSASPYVDLQSAESLAVTADNIRERGVAFHVVEARAGVRDRLRTAGVDARLGGVDRFSSVADVVDSYGDARIQ